MIDSMKKPKTLNTLPKIDCTKQTYGKIDFLILLEKFDIFSCLYFIQNPVYIWYTF